MYFSPYLRSAIVRFPLHKVPGKFYFGLWILNYQFLVFCSFVQTFKETVYPEPEELGSWNFERMFTLYHVSHVRCHMSCVMFHMSGVRCHVAHVTCQVSHVMYQLFSSFFFLFWQSGGASWWRVCYQQGLPRLVFFKCIFSFLQLRVN